MHVEEQLSSTVLGDDGSIAGGEWVDQMPVPMVEVNADIFAEVGQAVLLFQISRGIVSWDNDGSTLQILKNILKLSQIIIY